MEVLLLIVVGWFFAAAVTLLFVRAMGAAAARSDARSVTEDRSGATHFTAPQRRHVA